MSKPSGEMILEPGITQMGTNEDRDTQGYAWTSQAASVHSRSKPETKKIAEEILRKLGLSPTEAIRLFYTQITLRNGLPFNISIPNDETLQALDDSRAV